MEEKKEGVIVNNSNEMLVTGVLYGLMFACEILRADKIEGVKNPIANMVNVALDAADYKIFNIFSMIRSNQRVPDLVALAKEYKEKVAKSKDLEKTKKLMNDLYQQIKEGTYENK